MPDADKPEAFIKSLCSLASKALVIVRNRWMISWKSGRVTELKITFVLARFWIYRTQLDSGPLRPAQTRCASAGGPFPPYIPVIL